MCHNKIAWMAAFIAILKAMTFARPVHISTDSSSASFWGIIDGNPNVKWDSDDHKPTDLTDSKSNYAPISQREITEDTKLFENEFFVDETIARLNDFETKNFAKSVSLNAAKVIGFTQKKTSDFFKEETSSKVANENIIEINNDELQFFESYDDHIAKRKLQKQDDEDLPDTGKIKPRRLGIPGFCLNSPSMLNLFNTAAYAEQSSFNQGENPTAASGCDGDLIMINTVNPTGNPYPWDLTKLVGSAISNFEYWKVTFAIAISIKTTLFINRDDILLGIIQGFIVTVGNNADVTTNAVCLAQGTIIDGGWYLCPTSMVGTTFGAYTTTGSFTFLEAMAYSQEAIQMNALSASYLGTNREWAPVSNALNKIVILLQPRSGAKCVNIAPPTGGQATFSVKFKAQVPIKGVVVIPGYLTVQTAWPSIQNNVSIYGKTVLGAQQLCGVTGNYYTKYGDILCNIEANEIILVKQTSDLRFCGFGTLSDCNCAQSSFNPSLFTTTPATSFNRLYTDPPISIKLMPDTVSSVCGTADGFSKCGQRSISFVDKTTGKTITVWPYWGYSWDSASNLLTLDPTQATTTSVLTATIIMVNYPTVIWSQDILSTVQGGITIPDTPDAPITSANSDGSVTIKWTAPSSRGTPITAYTIAIQKSDKTYSSETVNCDGSDSSVILAFQTCTIPITILKTAPFNLSWGSQIYATVTAKNILGSSGVSNPGNGAVILSTLVIQTKTLNAVINEESILMLDSLPEVKYVVISKPQFEVSVDGKQLKVKSISQSDIGTYVLQMNATTSSQNANFTVMIIFKATFTQKDAMRVDTQNKSDSISVNSTSNTSKVTSSTDVTSQSDQADQLNLMKCTYDYGNISCADIVNSRFSCQFDRQSGQMVCGVDLVITTQATSSNADVKVPPTMVVSQVDSKGIFTMSFSEPMDFQSLFNKTYSFRGLKSKNGGSQSGGGSQGKRSSINEKEKIANSTDDFNRNKYLLSNKHFNITILSGGDEDDSKLKFEWFVLNITETSIKIQVLFKTPAYISSDAKHPDYLVIQLLPGFLVASQSKQDRLYFTNPIRTEVRRLTSQLVLGTVIETVEKAASAAKEATQVVVVGNLILSLMLNSVLGQIYTMVNSLQMMVSYSLMIVVMPPNVTLVMTQINTIASFDYLPTDQIFAICFDFSTTVMPFLSFQAMGVQSLRLTLFLGSMIVFMGLICLQSLLFTITTPFKKKIKLLYRFHKYMKANYYWRGIIRLMLESYFDLCVGIMLSWREPRFDNASDVFDFLITCFFTIVVIGGPISVYFLLRKYANELDQERFQKKYGSLTEGYKTDGLIGSKATRQIIIWFMVRRFLTAVALVYLGDQSPVFQIAAVMYISLADVLVNFNLDAFESQTNNNLAKINDTIVFSLSYFPFIYSGLVPDPENRYNIGWAQVSIIALMFMANLAAVIQCMIISIMEECRRTRVEQFNLHTLKGMGYVIVIVVETVWQKLARVCQVEWVFYDSRPPRLNEQIAPHVEVCQNQYAEHVVDQIDELKSYENARADQVQELEYYQDSRTEQIVPNVNDETRFVQNQPNNNQVGPSELLMPESQLLGSTFGNIQNLNSLGFTKRQKKERFVSIIDSVYVPEERKQQLIEEDAIIKEADAIAQQKESQKLTLVKNVPKEVRIERVKKCLEVIEKFEFNERNPTRFQEFSDLLSKDFELQSPKSQLKEVKSLYKLLDEGPAIEPMIEQNEIVRREQKPQLDVMQPQINQDIITYEPVFEQQMQWNMPGKREKEFQ